MARLRATVSALLARAGRTVAVAGSDFQRWAPETKVALGALKFQWMESTVRPFPLASAGFRIFSQFDEDGLLLAVFAIIGERSRTFVDLGSSDGLNSNCANLAINQGWWGLFVDGNASAVDKGRKFYQNHPDTLLYPPRFICAEISRESVNSLVDEAGLSGEIDLLSIDIDGNDYWVWHAIEQVRPRVVIIETRVEFGMHNIVVPYDPNYRYPGSDPDYFGASPAAMTLLAEEKGYRLIGSNLYGFNTIWVRFDEGVDALPTQPTESVLAHLRNTESRAMFERIKNNAFVQGGTGYPGKSVSGL